MTAEERAALYPHKVTIRAWNSRDNWFFDARSLDAKRADNPDGTVRFTFHASQMGTNTTPSIGSEITDAAGVVWVVTGYLHKMAFAEDDATARKKP
jgi:hypothetical protein